MSKIYESPDKGKTFTVREMRTPPKSNTNFGKVEQFMSAFGQDVETEPQWTSVSELRYELIREELEELREGLDNRDIVEIADALTDLLYVVYGAGHSFGINLDKCFKEVHNSNMSKLGEDGKPIYREDGKVLKGPNYWAPDLKKVLYNV
jgi:predicted HAD superfamily Cof-like phosphohydrolase|tara:strand:+ start:1148 stop:1594 length:447 start_codon:yes stop_codon:yes gene_type:complete